MANNVFANSRELSCKAGDGKSICEFPDVCFTPPQTPATPPGVPVPYPNTGLASDTTNGSKTVKISNKEVMLKDKSYYKKSSGDEAGSAPKKGIISSTNKGKVYFISWASNVKIEGLNVVRHIDMTTHNHASKLATGSVPTVDVDTVSPPAPPADGCAAAAENAEQADELGPKTATSRSGTTYETVPAGGFFVPSGGIPALPGVSQSGVSMMSHSSISRRDIRPGRNSKYSRMSGGQGGGVACPGKQFSEGQAGHAEVKMIEDILVGRYPGSLTRNAYKPKGTLYLTVKRQSICCSCQEAIKCAEKQGIKVEYCNDAEGKPTTKKKCT